MSTPEEIEAAKQAEEFRQMQEELEAARLRELAEAAARTSPDSMHSKPE